MHTNTARQWTKRSGMVVATVALMRVAVVHAEELRPIPQISHGWQGENDDRPKHILHVDKDHGRLNAPCTAVDPCARITDALTIARAMRYGLDPAIPAVAPDERIKIIVRASALPYLGSGDLARLAADPSLEKLPLLINISGLTLAGESKFHKDDDGWIDKDSPIVDATTLKSEVPLAGNAQLILIGVTKGMPADDVVVRGFVLDGNAAPGPSGFLIIADRARNFLVRHLFATNATYGVAAQGATGVVEGCLMTNLGEGVLVFGGNSTNWISDVTVRDSRSIANIFGALAFFGSSNVVNGLFPVVNLGAYQGAFEPVPFTGVIDRTVGRIIHNDLSHNSAAPNFVTSGLRMAPIGPNLPPGQSEGHLAMTVEGNRLSDNDHGFVLDAGFPFRASATVFSGSFAGRFADNLVTDSHTAKALITFTRHQAAEFPAALPAWKYLVGSRYHLSYTSGEFDETTGPSGRIWVDNPDVDPGDRTRTLNNELILRSR